MWASGSFTAAFELEMMVKNAAATGACSIYEQVSEMDFNQIGEKDGEQIGTGTTR